MEKRKKNRDCYDAIRSRIMLAKIRRRSDPSFSVMHQLLAIFGLITLAIPIPTISPSSSRLHFKRSSEERKEISTALGVAPRYVDIFLSKGAVPYSLLLDHLSGPATRRDALSELRKRVPTETLDWLSEIVRNQDWNRLKLCRGLDSEEQTEINILKAAARWEESRACVRNEPVLAPSGSETGSACFSLKPFPLPLNPKP